GIDINRFLSKPVLPSVLYNTIAEISDAVQPQIPQESDSNIPDWSGKHILIAEDIDINREIIYSILEETKINIDSATNGLEAVEKFKNNYKLYDVILMDVHMPELDGLDATKQIRASGLSTSRTIPIIAMTANAFKEDVISCLAAGMNEHLAKPIDMDVFFKVLSNYLEQAKTAER
ncbi:response regulator, partial [Eubacteriales bacterium OttesenSCG-928-G02]|nr:response regulator [Eubacteriales bacterium OttesenSCG-928-G02]